jgi:zinc finger protein
MQFPTACHACGKGGLAKMCVSTIPFFKEIIIMAFSCDFCGYKNTEIKQGGGISDKAKKITFLFQKPSDLNRDVFKSETCVLSVPEIDLVLTNYTLGSKFTTIEGLLADVYEQLDKNCPFNKGDSAGDDNKFADFLIKVKELGTGEKQFTLVLDDPLDNCFIYNPFAPEKDPQIVRSVS